MLALAVGAYVAARESPLFAVRTIQVDGAPPRIAAEVRSALEPLIGSSLLKVDGKEVERRLGGLATVAAASYDRAFPHTLRVYVRAEQPIAVLRQGAKAWLASSDGRLLRELGHPGLSSLPRVWLPRSASVTAGSALGDEHALRAVAALTAAKSEPLGSAIRDVRTTDSELTLMLRSGLEVRLGDASNLRLKLAIARRILPRLAPPGYLDVSVPTRAVALANSKVGG